MSQPAQAVWTFLGFWVGPQGLCWYLSCCILPATGSYHETLNQPQLWVNFHRSSQKKTERILNSETPSFIWIKSQIDFPDRQWKERDVFSECFIPDVNLRLGWISFFWRETQGLLSLGTQQVNRLHLMRWVMCLGFIFLLLSHKQPKPKQKGRAVYLFVCLIIYLFGDSSNFMFLIPRVAVLLYLNGSSQSSALCV